MKKILFLVLISSFFFVKSQVLEDETSVFNKKNEIRLNILDLVTAGTLDVSYERYLNNNQSLYVATSFFDNYNYFDLDADDYKSNAFSLGLGYKFYFSRKKLFRGFNFYPLLRFRAGNIEFREYFYDPVNNYMYNELTKYDVGSFQMGFGLEHKWRIASDKVSLGLNFELVRTLSGKIDTNNFSVVESRGGVIFGYIF